MGEMSLINHNNPFKNSKLRKESELSETTS